MAYTQPRIWTSTAGIVSSNAIITFNNTIEPAAVGSMLVALISLRPDVAATMPVTAITDNLGGTWVQPKDAEGRPQMAGSEADPTKYVMFARTNAGGVSQVQVTATAGVTDTHMIVHLAEYSTSPEGATPVWLAKTSSAPTAASWPTLTLDNVPAGSLLLGGITLSVTSRTLSHTGGYATLSEYKGNSHHNFAVWKEQEVTGSVTGPQFAVASGSNTSARTMFGAIVGSSTAAGISVDAGADREVYVGIGASLNAIVSDGSGPQTFSWSATGPGGTFSDNSSAVTTFTPTEAGSHTLTVSVTDNTGTATDTVVVTATALPAYDVTAVSGWSSVVGAATRLEALIDDSTGTYVQTGANPEGEELHLAFPSMSRPKRFMVPLELSAEGGAVTYVATLLVLDSGGAATAIALAPVTVNPGSVQAHTFVWEEAQISATTGWDLGAQVRVTATVD